MKKKRYTLSGIDQGQIKRALDLLDRTLALPSISPASYQRVTEISDAELRRKNRLLNKVRGAILALRGWMDSHPGVGEKEMFYLIVAHSCLRQYEAISVILENHVAVLNLMLSASFIEPEIDGDELPF